MQRGLPLPPSSFSWCLIFSQNGQVTNENWKVAIAKKDSATLRKQLMNAIHNNFFHNIKYTVVYQGFNFRAKLFYAYLFLFFPTWFIKLSSPAKMFLFHLFPPA